MDVGSATVEMDASHLNNGVYFAKIQIEGKTRSVKFLKY